MNYRKTLKLIANLPKKELVVFWYHLNTFCLKNDEVPSVDMLNSFLLAVLEPKNRPKNFWDVHPIHSLKVHPIRKGSKFVMVSQSYTKKVAK